MLFMTNRARAQTKSQPRKGTQIRYNVTNIDIIFYTKQSEARLLLL